jgi:hypothetical protein
LIAIDRTLFAALFPPRDTVDAPITFPHDAVTLRPLSAHERAEEYIKGYAAARGRYPSHRKVMNDARVGKATAVRSRRRVRAAYDKALSERAVGHRAA